MNITEDQLTLRQGLEHFYQENAQYLSHEKEGVSKKAKQFFKAHDVVHVLFGCDTTLFGEGSVKIWTLFGTTLGFRKHIAGYKEADAYQLSRNFTVGHVLQNLFKFLFHIPTLIIKAKRMKKPWPWDGYGDYLDRSIAQIREEYHIQP